MWLILIHGDPIEVAEKLDQIEKDEIPDDEIPDDEIGDIGAVESLKVERGWT